VGVTASVALLFTADQLASAAEAVETPVSGPPVKIGVVGLGQWGKDILASLSRVPSAQVTAICDTYEAYATRAKKMAPNAATFSDYRKLLESPEVEAVIVATPSHQHREIVIAAVWAVGDRYRCPFEGSSCRWSELRGIPRCDGSPRDSVSVLLKYNIGH